MASSSRLAALPHRLFSVAVKRGEAVVLERRYGVPQAASEAIYLDRFGLADDERNSYGPSPWGVLGRILPESARCPGNVFVDFGCGMGRVVLEASRYRFDRVVGVDIAPEFTAVAAEVLARNRQRQHCGATEIVTADVMEWPIPDDVTVAYLCNPFIGEIFDSVIERLISSVDRHPRRLWIAYYASPEHDRLNANSRVRFVAYGRHRFRPWRDADYLRLYEVVPGANPG